MLYENGNHFSLLKIKEDTNLYNEIQHEFNQNEKLFNNEIYNKLKTNKYVSINDNPLYYDDIYNYLF
jgi:hypothetical protein